MLGNEALGAVLDAHFGENPRKTPNCPGSLIKTLFDPWKAVRYAQLSKCRRWKKGGCWAEERLLGGLRQSVPQNGRVHLHISSSDLIFKIRSYF